MAKIEQFKCDGCGKLKTEVNHWWTVGTDVLHRIVLQPFDFQDRDEDTRDFCGQKCALEFISAQMAGAK